jgi:hypothetical protein
MCWIVELPALSCVRSGSSAEVMLVQTQSWRVRQNQNHLLLTSHEPAAHQPPATSLRLTSHLMFACSYSTFCSTF